MTTKQIILSALILNATTNSASAMEAEQQKKLDQETLAAADRGNFKEVIELVKAGANPNFNQGTKNTLLQHAVKAKSLEGVEELIKIGADDENGEALFSAATYSYPENTYHNIASHLIRHGKSNINAQPYHYHHCDLLCNGNTAAHMAAAHCDTEMLALLYQYKTNFTIKNDAQEIPLDNARSAHSYITSLNHLHLLPSCAASIAILEAIEKEQ